jgi:carbon monoxide dehydrogenase subunit G
VAIDVAKSFVVRAPRSAAWDFLTDPSRVVRCLPGAALTNQIDERTYGGTVTVKVGPVTASFKGTMRFERLDREAWTAEMVAAGQEVRGKGGADMRMTSQLVERTAGETEVTVTSQVNIVGVLAQFGRGMIQDVSDQLFQKFVDAARAELEPAASAGPAAAATTIPAAADISGAPPIDALSVGSTAVFRAAGRSARRLVSWILGR